MEKRYIVKDNYIIDTQVNDPEGFEKEKIIANCNTLPNNLECGFNARKIAELLNVSHNEGIQLFNEMCKKIKRRQ